MGFLSRKSQEILDRSADPLRASAQISRLGGMFLNELHGHHQIEDMHYFPALRAQDARLAAGFDLLDADHHALDAGIEMLADRMNAVLRGLAGRPADLTAAGSMLDGIERFGNLLDRHLTDEEDLIVPVILEYRGAGLG